MSYILCPYDNYYKPSESLQHLFENRVVRPFKEHSLTQPWVDHVRSTDHMYHRKTILDQGRANFNEPFEDLSPEDKVLIYCIYYMPMHLFSSYHIFTNYLQPINNKVVLVDFGCGPLTSGIAFWAAFAGQRDITYLGIDSSEAMVYKAQEINRYGPYGGEPFIPTEKGRLIFRYSRLLEYLDYYIATDDQTQIIFNFCYFLASHTLDINDLFNILIPIIKKYSQHKMFVVYQNPPIPLGHNLQSSYLHKNWYFLKTQLPAFHSQITQSNTEQFCYDSLIDGLPVTLNFYFDLLSNGSSVLSNDPSELPSIF